METKKLQTWQVTITAFIEAPSLQEAELQYEDFDFHIDSHTIEAFSETK